MDPTANPDGGLLEEDSGALDEPSWHSGRAPAPIRSSTRGIREGFPTWTVDEVLEPNRQMMRLIGCPRCGYVARVQLEGWLSFPGETRPCTYCFKANRIPEELKS